MSDTWTPPAPVQETETATVVARPQDLTMDQLPASSTTTAAPATVRTRTAWNTQKAKLTHGAAVKHEHLFNKLIAIAEPVDKIILAMACTASDSCLKHLAFDMGSKDAMRIMYSRIKGAQA